MLSTLPHVAAVQDISGMGRCALTIALPVLSVMGCRCSPLPTAYLSASTIYPESKHFVIRNLTGEMEGTIAHWKELNVSFHAVYTGFLASLPQIRLLQAWISQLRDTLVLVDPVMADHGRVYRTYTPQMCQEMVGLAAKADIITPNLTEGSILLGKAPECVPQTDTQLGLWLEQLSLDGKRSVVLTGVHPSVRDVGAACFNRETGKISLFAVEEAPAQFPGTGDLFASVVLGTLLREGSLEGAVRSAVQFVGRCAKYTADLGTPIEEGVQFEPFLEELLPRWRDSPS